MIGILVPYLTFFRCIRNGIWNPLLIKQRENGNDRKGNRSGVHKATPKPFLSLKFGLLLVGLGIGLLVALFTVRGVFGSDMTRSEKGQSVAIYFGFIGIFGGLGLIVSYLVERNGWIAIKCFNIREVKFNGPIAIKLTSLYSCIVSIITCF